MLILAINTAMKHNEIALLDDDKVLFEKTWLSKKDEGEKLLPAVKKAFEQSKKQIGYLRKIFVVAGPGSFTGLRIGISIANSFAFSLKIPVISCGTGELIQSEHARSFGNAVIMLMKLKLKNKKYIHPVYLKKPHITKSKKPVFTSSSRP